MPLYAAAAVCFKGEVTTAYYLGYNCYLKSAYCKEDAEVLIMDMFKKNRPEKDGYNRHEILVIDITEAAMKYFFG